jgi:uncharacterized membrane protein YkoI
MAGEISKAKYEKGSLSWNSIDASNISTFLGKTVVVTGRDKNGVSQQIVAKVERLNMDKTKTKISLTTKGVRSVGATARDVVDLNKKNFEWLYNVSINYPDMKRVAMLSIDGKVNKKSKSSIWVEEITPLKRVVKVENDKVTSENASNFLKKFVGKKSKAVLQTNHGNINGEIIISSQTNGKWASKFKKDQMPHPVNFELVEFEVIGILWGDWSDWSEFSW